MNATEFIHPEAAPSLRRFIAGLFGTDLVTDIRARSPHTLIAPVDPAFDRLHWSFDQLLWNDDLVEPRFDLFEYLVIPGLHLGALPELETVRTVQGEPIRIGAGLVLGRHGVGRILATTTWEDSLVHVVDACVLPSTVVDYIPEDRVT